MLAPSGFNPNAFTACYGMAECSLAVSFSSLDKGIQLDTVDPELLADEQRAEPVSEASPQSSGKFKNFVTCGFPLPGFEVDVRSSDGQSLPGLVKIVVEEVRDKWGVTQFEIYRYTAKAQ